MNRKHLFAGFDEADDEDYEFLGSRLRHAVEPQHKKPLARTRRVREQAEKPRYRERPEPYRDRSY